MGSFNYNGLKLYAPSDYSAEIPTGSVVSQWEIIDPTISSSNANTTNFNINRFFKHKVTKLIVGMVGLSNIGNKSGTLFTDSRLARSSSMPLVWPGQLIYTAGGSGGNWKRLLKIQTSGDFVWDGGGYDSTGYIENFAYLASDAIVTETEPTKKLIYTKYGAFYEENDQNLYTGRAWFKKTYTGISNCSSDSYIVFFKNFWSGEIIMQYRLINANKGTGSVDFTPDSRFNPIMSYFCHTPRYDYSGSVSDGSQHTCYNTWEGSYFHWALNTVNFSTFGTVFYQGTPEVSPDYGSIDMQPLWMNGSDKAMYAVGSDKYPHQMTPSNLTTIVKSAGGWCDTTEWTGRDTSSSARNVNQVCRNNRTGTTFVYWDLHKKSSANAPFSVANTDHWTIDWVPSYIYNKSSSNQYGLWCCGETYMPTRNSGSDSDFSCNMYIPPADSLTAMRSGKYRAWSFGTYGALYTGWSCDVLLYGFFVGNLNANVKQT